MINRTARTYFKTFKCSETFPCAADEEWLVREGGKVVERWYVLWRKTTLFKVEIMEFAAP